MRTEPMDYASSAKVAGAISTTKQETLIETLGRVVERSEGIKNAVERITHRLLSEQVGVENADCAPPPYGNAQLDADRANRTLSNLESALSYLEARLG